MLKRASTNLFDIASRKCLNFDLCNCPRSEKVPTLERPFLKDQRTSRKMFIGAIDEYETEKIRKRESRVVKRKSYLETDHTCSKQLRTSSPTNSISSSPVSSLSDTEFSISGNQNRNFTELVNLAEACDRYNVSNTAGAAIATATLIDYGVISTDETSLVIDRSKLWRHREKLRKQFLSKDSSYPKSIYFDGKKDSTLQCSGVLQEEEHITLLEEPYSKYLGHTTPTNSKANSIFQSIVDYTFENKISLTNLLAIGCDGTGVNTGRQNGVIRKLELHINQPLQWLVCLLHLNELPLRQLFKFYGHHTVGPNHMSGELSDTLINCASANVENFASIPNSIHEFNLDNVMLSTDQKYLYDICLAINYGVANTSILNRNPGTISHSRWLTTANRVLRSYISTSSPSSTLQNLTNYICHVYAPTWFNIKCNPQSFKGAIHFWKLTHSLDTVKIEEEAKNELKKVLARNGYFANCENILLAMVFDPEESRRKLAIERIVEARRNEKPEIRSFQRPENINFEANSYENLISWEKTLITPPAILKNVSNNDLYSLWQQPLNISKFSFPCHNQATERHIKMVSEASKSVQGQNRRDGYIMATIQSREKIPAFQSKSDWKL